MYRILRDKDNKTDVKLPSMPLIMVLGNQTIIESDSITGLVAAMVGSDYVNQDNKQKCLMRIKLARREVMFVLQFDITAVISNGKYIIKNNYAVDPYHEDYVYDKDELADAVKIRIDDEKLFLKSLIKLKAIRVLERSDSNIFITPVNTKGDHKNDYIEVGPE